jgi:hypothetical protein
MLLGLAVLMRWCSGPGSPLATPLASAAPAPAHARSCPPQLCIHALTHPYSVFATLACRSCPVLRLAPGPHVGLRRPPPHRPFPTPALPQTASAAARSCRAARSLHTASLTSRAHARAPPVCFREGACRPRPGGRTARGRDTPRHRLAPGEPPHRCHCLHTVDTALSSHATPYLRLKQLYGAAGLASVMFGENATFPSSTMSRPSTRNHVLLLSNSLQRLFGTDCACVCV